MHGFFACGKEHMHLIVCLDDENGMAFLGRRQSRDRLLPGDIAAHCEGPLYALPYSLPLLKEAGLTAVAAAPSEVPENGIFFDELLPPSGFMERADFVTVYRWNRLYPADVYFDADLAAEFKQVSARDFAGFSHDRITCELWKRKRRSADNSADNNTDKGETK